MKPTRGFGSDNHSGVHPQILSAIVAANVGHAPSYGTDEWSEKANQVIRTHFGERAKAAFVFNGTAANVLGLSTMVRAHHAVISSEHSHLLNDECGAPEFVLGCKMISVPSRDAKLTPASIKPFLIRRGDQHFSQARVISITQPTELGTLYTLDEIRELRSFADREGLLLHMDGARLVNAAASLNCSLRALTTDCGVDVVSLGGTKNGLMFGEAVVFLKPEFADDFKYQRKQHMQLPSKTRFIASQFCEFLGTDLWLKNAQHANQMAKLLSQGLSRSAHAEITQATQANAVFVRFPKSFIPRLRESAFFYVWNEHTFESRLMTSWDTQADEVDAFLGTLEHLGASEKVRTS